MRGFSFLRLNKYKLFKIEYFMFSDSSNILCICHNHHLMTTRVGITGCSLTGLSNGIMSGIRQMMGKNVTLY